MKKKPLDGTSSLQFPALSDGWALEHRALSERASWTLKELGTNSLYKYTCCRLRLVTHPSGSAELLKLHWVVSEPTADTTSVQHVVTMLIRVSWL